MESFVGDFVKYLSNLHSIPLLESLKKQNELFDSTESTKLLVEEDVSSDDDSEWHEDETGLTRKEVAQGVLKKIAQLFEYTTIIDKGILLLGFMFTIIHAACFPIMAILFGKISNAYIAHTLLEMKNSIKHVKANATELGTTGKLTLGILTEVVSKVRPGMNASVVPIGNFSGGGYFGNISPYQSNGTETLDDFASYVEDFSLYCVYIGLAVFVSTFFQITCWEWVAENQLYRIRQMFICQLLRQDQSWFRKHKAGTLVLKIADDCERYREGVGQNFSMVIECITIALFGAGIGLITSFKLTVVFLGSAPFILTKLILLWKIIAEKSVIQQNAYAKGPKICSEVFGGLKTVAALCGERREIDRYEKALRKSTEAAGKRNLLVGIGIGGMYFLIYCFYAIALWYSVNLLVVDAITPGEIYTVFFSITICAFALGSILPYTNSIATSLGSLELLRIVLDSVPNVDPYSSEGELPIDFSGQITFDNVKFEYPGTKKGSPPVFKNLNLEINTGQVVAIVGLGSSGKSTLIQLLLRFYDPQKGQIKLDMHDVKDLNVRWIREQVDVVEQNAMLPPVETILEVIRGGQKDIKLDRVKQAAKCAMIHTYIMSLTQQYDTPIIVPGGKEFSTGQRQRMLIARSILLNPKILILDEAMDGIEVPIALQIRKNLANLRKNSTTILIARKLAIAQHADFIFVLEDGKVVEKGVHVELDELHGLYYEMLQHEGLMHSIPEDNLPAAETMTVEARDDIPENTQDGLEVKGEKSRSKFHGKKRQKIELPHVSRILNVLPHKAVPLFFGLLGCILSGLVIPVLALCLSQILQMFLSDKEELLSSGIFWVEVLLSLAIAASVGYCLRTIFISSFGEQLTAKIQILCFESIVRQPISWFDLEKNSSDFLYARLASDIPFIKNAVGQRLANAISNLITMVTGFIIVMIYAWQMALVAMLTIPVLLVVLYFQKKTQHKAYIKLSRIRKNIIKLTSRCVNGIWAIQANSKAFPICQRMKKIFFKALVEGQKQALSYGLGFAISECMTVLMIGASFRLGAVLIKERVLAIPDLFTIWFVLTFGSLSFAQGKAYALDFFKGRLSSYFIFKLIEMKSTLDPMDETGLKPVIQGKIELKNVVFSYPISSNVKILQGASLTIPKGSVIGIVGPAGEGKSTILSILERFYDVPSGSGEVLIDGENLKDFNLQHLRQNIGYVTQEPLIFNKTMRRNILYGYIKETDLENDLNTAAAVADIYFYNLPKKYQGKLGEHGSMLSPGQKQQVALARAIINKPPIMLLDNPTSSFDAEEEMLVLDELAEETKGRTCIIVSNSYSCIKYCEYIAFVAEGKIAEFGKQTELLKAKGVYYHFIREQGAKLDDIEKTASSASSASSLPKTPSVETSNFIQF